MNRSQFPSALIAACFLQALPLSAFWLGVAPDWLLAIVLTRALISPKKLNLITVWLVGLLADELMGSLLGVHAGLYTLAVYLLLSLHRQLRAFPLHQLCLFVAVLVFMVQGGSLLLMPEHIYVVSMLDACLSSLTTTIVLCVSLIYLQKSRSEIELSTRWGRRA